MLVGELYWADLPASGGREQAGRRPVLVLQDDAHAHSLPTALIVPLTSALAAQRFPGTVGTVEPTILTQVYSALDQLTGHP